MHTPGKAAVAAAIVVTLGLGAAEPARAVDIDPAAQKIAKALMPLVATGVEAEDQDVLDRIWEAIQPPAEANYEPEAVVATVRERVTAAQAAVASGEDAAAKVAAAYRAFEWAEEQLKRQEGKEADEAHKELKELRRELDRVAGKPGSSVSTPAAVVIGLVAVLAVGGAIAAAVFNVPALRALLPL